MTDDHLPAAGQPTAESLSETIAAAIESSVATSSLQELKPAIDLIRAQRSLDTNLALDIVEAVTRRMPGLVSVLEASNDAGRALKRVEAGVAVLGELRSAVRESDRGTFDLLVEAGKNLEARLRQRAAAVAASASEPTPEESASREGMGYEQSRPTARTRPRLSRALSAEPFHGAYPGTPVSRPSTRPVTDSRRPPRDPPDDPSTSIERGP